MTRTGLTRAALLASLGLPLALRPVAAEDLPREYVAHINEPFLTFETRGQAAIVTSPTDIEGTSVPIERLEAADVVQVTGTYEGQRFVVTIVARPCEDDMAGLPYSHTAAMSWGDVLKDGCARLTTEPQPREGS